MYTVGIDIGTSSCKVVAVDTAGNLLAKRSREYPSLFPRPGWVEVDPVAVWEVASSCLVEVAAECADAEVGYPEAIGISASGDEVLPLDDAGAPLYRTIMSADIRGAGQVEAISLAVGEERIREITGLPLSHKYGINRIKWFAEEMPDLFRMTARFAAWEDFIAARLTGRYSCSASSAARLMCFDIQEGDWSPEILNAAGIGRELLPEVVRPGEVTGTVRANAGPGLDALEGIKVVAGGFDQACSALGCGIVEPGIVGIGTGTMESVVFHVSGRLGDVTYPANPSLTGEGFVFTVTNPSGGAAFRWFRDNFAGVSYETLTSEMPQGASGLLVMPHFSGAGTPVNDPQSSAVVIGLRLSTTRGEAVKALLEGVTFETKMVAADFVAKSGIVPREVRAVGGGARSDEWLQIKADILGSPIYRMEIGDTSALGAAMLAAVGAGAFKSGTEAAAAMVRKGKPFLPDRQRSAAYEEYFRIYSRLYPSLSEILHDLDELCSAGRP